ncbi:hypothetical protein RhiirC2_865796 [Rhizophagus irregularis]|uniref:Uncharacterized protein n=1 Tax=Rhizophagus irregularis TaxID=588596 RepID=A0A2N1NB37_9GLOM|nr:hypothetical protein RhiirC2_865796 [Rhizophagus irregularis]
MQSLNSELRIEIFKFTSIPYSLSLINREWCTTSQDPDARAEWSIYKYGKSHVLFHAVRLGNGFITEKVIEALLKRNAIISRYFLQRLLMHFGTHDELLKRERNLHNQIDFSAFHAFQPPPWASNLSLTVFTKLLTEGYKVLDDNELATKGNDMELFHFLSAGPLVINYAPQKLFQNLGEIKDLILNKRFIPFPPRPKPIYEDSIDYIQLMQANSHEEYPSRDGYENYQQLSDVSRAILIHPDLVNMWKKIGYYEICSDFNELVIQGAISNLFPREPPTDWECPDTDIIIKRLDQLINVGFKLTDIIIEEILFSFEHRLNDVGDLLMNSFQKIREESISIIASSCLIQTIKPERYHRKFDLLEFLIKYIDDQPEKAWEKALKHYNVGFKYDIDTIKSVEMRSLSVHSNIYYWILQIYGPNYKITQQCFEDIIESRIWIDLQLQEYSGMDVPEQLTSQAFNSICSIYLEFCNQKIPFKGNYLPYLRLASNEEIIKPLFELSLPIIFGLKLKYDSPFDINYEYDRPNVNKSFNQNNKRKFNETEMNNDQQNGNEKKEWFTLLEEMYYGPIHANNSDITRNFKKKFEEFWERITPSQVSVVAEQSTDITPKKPKTK